MIWFWILEIGLYILYMGMDIQGMGQTAQIKYGALLMCLAVGFAGTLIRAKTRPFHYGLWLCLGYLLTPAADWFLLIRNTASLTGIGLFYLAQTSYGLYLYYRGRQVGLSGKKWLIMRLMAALALVGGLMGKQNMLFWLGAAYGGNLLMNGGAALELCVEQRKKDPGGEKDGFWLFLGFCLFAGCDLCVVLYNTVPWSGRVGVAVGLGMWFFYLPSQWCLAKGGMLFGKGASFT